MGVTQGAGLSLKWFRDNFCAAEKEVAAGMGVDPYYLMDQQAARAPIGCNRLIYLPYLMGERTPHLDPDCRGAFIGLSAIHTKYEMCIRDSCNAAERLARRIDHIPFAVNLTGLGHISGHSVYLQESV